MKILVISQYWYPENGVPQRRWTWLSDLLRSKYALEVIAPPPHYRRNLKLLDWAKQVVGRGRGDLEFGPSGERIHRTFFIPGGNSLTQKALNQLTVAMGMMLKLTVLSFSHPSRKPDVIIGTVPALPTAVVTYFASKVLRAPYIIDLRDAWPDLLSQSDQWNNSVGSRSFREFLLSHGPLQGASWLTDRSVNWVLAHSSGVMVTSSHLEENLRSRFSKNGRELPLVTIRNVFPSRTDFVRQYVNEDLKGTLNVLYAGTIGRAQNLANAVEAAKIAATSGVDVHLRFVGAGAAKEALREMAEALGVHAEFYFRRPADALDEHYEWADTALVHLTDWEPLERAVPSKTYELMSSGLHISGVVAGEAAEIIEYCNAGEVVPPERPRELAALWVRLANNLSELRVGNLGREWVAKERTEIAPEKLYAFIRNVFGDK
ncbi:glycosyltransferase family 4 protein [Corynebacterium sp. c8Ua_181]|uniref:Glycosyltransferase family 4 protein n=1 Tax=Corynebacterium curieae TaxID=2913500 RepID=A0A9X3M926_9CORY|nr:glycosyltransferase family 4 protein [Corynebacterium curieae]MCZ9306434.1 glycosyltransferase family 4 protein [Corynebacterium curieae]